MQFKLVSVTQDAKVFINLPMHAKYTLKLKELLQADSVDQYIIGFEAFRELMKHEPISDELAAELAKIMEAANPSLNAYTLYFKYALLAYTKNHSYFYDLETKMSPNEVSNMQKVMDLVKSFKLFTTPEADDMTLEEKIKGVLTVHAVRFSQVVPVSLISALINVPQEDIYKLETIPHMVVGEEYVSGFHGPEDLQPWNNYKIQQSAGVIVQTVVNPISE